MGGPARDRRLPSSETRRLLTASLGAGRLRSYDSFDERGSPVAATRGVLTPVLGDSLTRTTREEECDHAGRSCQDCSGTSRSEDADGIAICD